MFFKNKIYQYFSKIKSTNFDKLEVKSRLSFFCLTDFITSQIAILQCSTFFHPKSRYCSEV